LLGWREIIVGVIPSVVRKIEAWLVVAKARRRKWPKWWRRVGKEKLGRKMVFFSTLASDFSPRQLSPHSLMPFAK